MAQQQDSTLALVAQLRDELAALQRRVGELEQQLARVAPPGPTEDEMLVISAAVAAFLGVRARIQQVRVLRSSAWATVGRIGVHASHRFN